MSAGMAQVLKYLSRWASTSQGMSKESSVDSTVSRLQCVQVVCILHCINSDGELRSVLKLADHTIWPKAFQDTVNFIEICYTVSMAADSIITCQIFLYWNPFRQENRISWGKHLSSLPPDLSKLQIILLYYGEQPALPKGQGLCVSQIQSLKSLLHLKFLLCSSPLARPIFLNQG